MEQRQLFRYCVRDFKGIETGSCYRGDIVKGSSRCTSVRLGVQSRRSARINGFKVSLASGLVLLLSSDTPLLTLSDIYCYPRFMVSDDVQMKGLRDDFFEGEIGYGARSFTISSS